MSSFTTATEWSGTIYIFHAFDVGDDIQLSKIAHDQKINTISTQPPKYFKNYHTPLAINPIAQEGAEKAFSVKLYNFGVISLCYQIPFNATIDELKNIMVAADAHYEAQSVHDAYALFSRIRDNIKQATFFNVRSTYTLIQINPQPNIAVVSFQELYGASIASALRFETEMLSDYQKDEILASGFGYYRGDLAIIDYDAAFLYDDDLSETIDLFEFAHVQRLELQFFDRLLDTQLQAVYERKVQAPSARAYLPFIGVTTAYPLGALEQLKVDISVITERLEHAIQSLADIYYSEIYERLTQKLELKTWTDAIYKKLKIIEQVSQVYQNRIDTIRGDLLSVAVIVLIFLEIILLILK